MPREISDEEYYHLQGRKQVADFVEPIYNHPTWGKEAKRLIKQVYPQVKIPDYDLEHQIDSRFAAEDRKREEREQAERVAAQDRNWREKRAKVEKDYGFTKDGMEKLEKWMVDNEVANYEVAASYMASKEPKTSEATYAEHYWHHDRQPGWDDAVKDPEGYAFKEFVGAMRRDEARAKQQGY